MGNPITGFISLAVPACDYEGGRDPNDHLDAEVVRQLQLLEEDESSALTFRRLAKGRYEIDGSRVAVHWSGADGQGSELLIREEGITDPSVPSVSFEDYLRTAVGIAVQINPSAP